MSKVSDLVTQFLVDHGVDDIFMVTGGGIMHLVDSVGRQRGLRYVCNHHEQACAIAAESYARALNRPGVCLVTTGPGSTNALSAIPGAWVDSIPVLVISGQVRRDLIADYSRTRQVGPQEINIIDMVRPVTKYAVTLTEPGRVLAELEIAWREAVSGRPGPVWVNIPLDVQGAEVAEGALAPLPPPAQPAPPPSLEEVMGMLRTAHRPLWIFGNGVHLAGGEAAMLRAVEALGFPALLTIGGMDLLAEDHPLHQGHFGPVGQRRANFALQNADLLLAVGTSLSIAAVGFGGASFAPRARKILVNIAPGEAERRDLRIDLEVAGDARSFLDRIARSGPSPALDPRWLEACREWKRRYPLVTPDYLADPDHINTYVFAARLSTLLGPEDLVVTGNSLDIVSVYHSFAFKAGQRGYTNSNYGAMGWDLPAAVGAAVARKGRRVVLVTGDGSFQFNLQELLAVKQYGLDVKIFIVNNQGYEAIRASQRSHFQGRFFGSDPASGIGNPDYRSLAAAYGIAYARIASNRRLDEAIQAFLAVPGPGLCELHVSYHQLRSPRATSVLRPDGTFEARPLEDMFPFLDPEEVRANMSLFPDPVR